MLADPNAWERPRRILLTVTAILGLIAFVLGVGNRFTGGPLFVYIPDVDLVPPLSKVAWQQAFVIHQQSPLFALCGGYQVGGMESLTVYQVLYLWEWARAGSVTLLSLCVILLVALTVRQAVRPRGHSDFVALVAAALLFAAYAALRYFADHAGLFATLNFGQHRHAVDVTFAATALALLLRVCLAPSQDRGAGLARTAWAIAIAIDIAFGALFQATDAAAVWKTFPGYADGILPATDRLFAFNPVWRNFTENVYLIQTCHRVLSIALWIVALGAWSRKRWRGLLARREALLFALLTLEGALGVATLMLDLPLVLSIAHQFCAIFVLAVALWPPLPGRTTTDGPASSRGVPGLDLAAA
ncbi:MAG TPA: COX15/CtaA family protein [Pseudolabrys sp.]|jgi:cytochrome c oxidase assembly protein subunit 15